MAPWMVQARFAVDIKLATAAIILVELLAHLFGSSVHVGGITGLGLLAVFVSKAARGWSAFDVRTCNKMFFVGPASPSVRLLGSQIWV